MLHKINGSPKARLKREIRQRLRQAERDRPLDAPLSPHALTTEVAELRALIETLLDVL